MYIRSYMEQEVEVISLDMIMYGNGVGKGGE